MNLEGCMVFYLFSGFGNEETPQNVDGSLQTRLYLNDVGPAEPGDEVGLAGGRGGVGVVAVGGAGQELLQLPLPGRSASHLLRTQWCQSSLQNTTV